MNKKQTMLSTAIFADVDWSLHYIRVFKKTTYTRYFWLVLGWYVEAKIFEHFDHQSIYLAGFCRGHTLKHLIAAFSLYYLLKLFQAWDAAFLNTK